ncbi:ankyrin repeat and LEM domain-containing protein 2 homolog [Anopheles maculipalpis]|uniref:ankyrin repeat and LEM domain-containing protein 2 homolog n=1 Tax=Anopheles maculipalpis TaxID=1496333 RepID=UPI0021594CA5|nr:ankyrin repeat and LEM domain-containing protein 2 homolog [Anopheles maculipalpis]
MYYGVTKGTGSNQVLIASFGRMDSALFIMKLWKDARMFIFPTEAAKTRFENDLQSHMLTCEGPQSVSRVQRGVKLPFESREDIKRFLYTGDFDTIGAMIDKHPVLLISQMNTPRRYGGLNALQIAAMKGSVELCRKILTNVENPSYVAKFEGGMTGMTYEISAKLVDLYLNMPDRRWYETALHYAVRYGQLDVVKLLVSYPQCEQKRNINGLYPSDIICHNAKRDETILNGISAMFIERFFVALILTEGDFREPYVVKPFTYKNLPDISPVGKFKYTRHIAAAVGPMTKRGAEAFYNRWRKNPSVAWMSAQPEACLSKNVKFSSV